MNSQSSRNKIKELLKLPKWNEITDEKLLEKISSEAHFIYDDSVSEIGNLSRLIGDMDKRQADSFVSDKLGFNKDSKTSTRELSFWNISMNGWNGILVVSYEDTYPATFFVTDKPVNLRIADTVSGLLHAAFKI